MRHRQFSHIGDLLQNSQATCRLLERRQHEEELLIWIRARLPEPMRAHCLDVGISGERLTLYFDSPAWTTRARFLAMDLLAELKGRQITEVYSQVRLSHPAGTAQATRMTVVLSLKAARHLLDAAEHLRNPELSEAFRRLATRHTPKEHT